MEKQQAGQWVVPNPQIPRSFGLMNIIFGGLFLLFGIGSAAWTYIAPRFTQQIQVSMQQQLEQAKTKRQGEIAALKEKLKAAKTEEEKKDLETELKALESNEGPDPAMFNDMMTLGSDIRLVIYQWTELSVGILLNVLTIIAGVGLLGLAEWSRKMAISVAWLKIAKWTAVVFFTMVVIVPLTAEKMQKMFTKIEAQAAAKGARGAQGFPMGGLAELTAVMTAVGSVGMAVVASIYPAISIWFLTRPRARAACLATTKPADQWPGGELAGS